MAPLFNKENFAGKKIFSFGEILLRMSPTANSHWLQRQQMPVYLGGSECNVAAALGLWKVPVQYCTAMPENYVSASLISYLHERNTDTSPIIFSGNRIGIFFMQQGTDMKHTGVIYDRMHSSFASLTPGVIDWDEKLKNACWFHFSAISPSLNKNAAAVCEEALQAAAKKNIFISADLNYRAKLWQQHRNPLETMPQLTAYCDVIMGNIWSANSLLGAPLESSLLQSHSDEDYAKHSEITAKYIQQQFSKCKLIANTFRFDNGANGVRYFASLHTQEEQFLSQQFLAETITDKVGSGDCFMAGLIYGLYHQLPPADIVNFAAAAAFGKLQEKSDITFQTADDVWNIIQQNRK